MEQEKADVNAELRKKLAEIEEMHKKLEEKSEGVAENASQINALLLQLDELKRFLN
jgi:peptidoglycan hydrolase CwlO-like protein